MQKDALLACDMDGTVIPLETGEEREREIREFSRLLALHENVVPAYITGRHLELGLAGVEQYRLPVPEIFVCDVGTTIYVRSHKGWVVDEQYRHALLRSWQGLTGADIGAMLDSLSVLIPQEEEKQKEFKQSYYVSPDVDHRKITTLIHDCLGSKDVRANVIYSVDSKKDIGLVDVLPEAAAKDSALIYLWKKLGLEKDRIVYAGDSGNDLLAFVSGFNAIVVNNTPQAVKEEVRRQTREKEIEEKIYYATAMYVQGVMEGCFHFNIFRS
jgi:HAD superfamily hydrolase (TIGR01484 family)